MISIPSVFHVCFILQSTWKKTRGSLKFEAVHGMVAHRKFLMNPLAFRVEASVPRIDYCGQTSRGGAPAGTSPHVVCLSVSCLPPTPCRSPRGLQGAGRRVAGNCQRLPAYLSLHDFHVEPALGSDSVVLSCCNVFFFIAKCHVLFICVLFS